MSNSDLPLKSLTIGELYNGANATYEVPIYQRNYAWKKEEIATLIQDVYDSMIHRKENYYIGTLVSFHKGGNVFEVIDGQQRLTTLNLILNALGIPLNNQLTYRARKKSNDSIRSIPHFNIDQKDAGIVDGFQSAEASLKEIVPVHDTANFCSYFLNKVHIIHYQVPRDVDLNHYFEIMNSRGEQLEKHEIVKARLIEKLSSDEDKNKFHQLWEFCSQMNVYIQQKYNDPNIFGDNYCTFKPKGFGDLPPVTAAAASDQKTVSIKDILTASSAEKTENTAHEIDAFQPILDFSNFLLIVLKITRISDPNDDSFDPMKFTLDDKNLLNEFDELGELTEDFVRQFGYNLLKAKFLLDNYVVHHSIEEDTLDNNPWKLQQWYKEDDKSAYLKNSGGKDEAQFKLVHLLSMFEVSFTARQRKNYLFYCLFYFFRLGNLDIKVYCNFVQNLAEKYVKDVYLNPENLNDINVPKPGSFDATLLVKDESGIWKIDEQIRNTHLDFNAVFGDGSAITKGIPLFVFNYLDYAIWHRYFEDLRGDPAKNEEVVSAFFDRMGCTKFDLNMFHHFYFSRTRRSLEHYFPQANANGVNGVPTQEQINCFGNYAMIGSDVNSSASNWTPRVKRDHYLDASGKIRQVSVASLKFLIMLQQCKDNADLRDAGEEWLFQDIQVHQRLMVDLLLNSIKRTHHQTPC